MGVEDATANNMGYASVVTGIFGGSSVVTNVLLTRSNTDINAQGITGNTPLMWAALWGKADIASSLLQQGADYLLRNSDDDDALAIAAKAGYRDIVILLRSYGAK